MSGKQYIESYFGVTLQCEYNLLNAGIFAHIHAPHGIENAIFELKNYFVFIFKILHSFMNCFVFI